MKRKGLIFLSSNIASNSNNKLDYFLTVLIEMESGEIEWFEYKFVLKKQSFICWALLFNRLTTGNCELYGFDTQENINRQSHR